MTESKPFSKDLPALSAQQSQSLAFQCSDIVLNLSPDMVVLDVACSGSVARRSVEGWEGCAFSSLVSTDSQPKIDILLEDNSARRDISGKWRHLNFLSSQNEDLPLLIKFFRFVHEGTSTNLICARDLRPLSEAREQWQNQQTVLQQKYENQVATLEDQLRVDSVINAMIKMVGKQPLENLVSSSLHYIERQCCIEALHRSNGDRDAAATLLGVTVDALQEKLRRN